MSVICGRASSVGRTKLICSVFRLIKSSPVRNSSFASPFDSPEMYTLNRFVRGATSAMSVQIASPLTTRGTASGLVGGIGRFEISMVDSRFCTPFGYFSLPTVLSSNFFTCSKMRGCGSSRWVVFRSLVTSSNSGRQVTGSAGRSPRGALYTWYHMYHTSCFAGRPSLSNPSRVAMRIGLYRKCSVQVSALSSGRSSGGTFFSPRFCWARASGGPRADAATAPRNARRSSRLWSAIACLIPSGGCPYCDDNRRARPVQPNRGSARRFDARRRGIVGLPGRRHPL
jgi:hypothetical protein